MPEEKNDTKKKENEEDDWLASPPPKTLTRTKFEEDSMLQELRYNVLAVSVFQFFC